MLYGLAAGLSAKGYHQSIVCLNNVADREICRKFQCLGIKVHIIGKWQLIFGIGFVRILFWLFRGSFDAAITLLFFSDVIGLLLSRIARIPYLISSQQSSNIHYSYWQRAAVGQSLKRANLVVLNSETYKKSVLSSYVPSSSELKVISNGIQVSTFNSEQPREAVREVLRLPSNSRLVGNVGRLSEEKGIDLLITAISVLPRTDVHLVLAGAGPIRKKLETQAAEAGLQSRVHFLGYCDDVTWVYDGIDVYVQASRFEGMPMSVMEAMASTCAVVATAVDGTRELIPNDGYGWLVSPDNPSELAKAIEEALNDPIEATRRAGMGNVRVRDQFSLGKVVNSWDCLLTRGCR